MHYALYHAGISIAIATYLIILCVHSGWVLEHERNTSLTTIQKQCHFRCNYNVLFSNRVYTGLFHCYGRMLGRVNPQAENPTGEVKGCLVCTSSAQAVHRATGGDWWEGHTVAGKQV